MDELDLSSYSTLSQDLLTMKQKQQRVNYSKSCLSLLAQNKQCFLHQDVVMDETWIHHCWSVAAESRLKSPKTNNHLVVMRVRFVKEPLALSETLSSSILVKEVALHSLQISTIKP